MHNGSQRGSADSGGYSQHMWNYDKIAMNEPMAEAFRAFANRALCQESVWFLEEVARYEHELHAAGGMLNLASVLLMWWWLRVCAVSISDLYTPLSALAQPAWERGYPTATGVWTPKSNQ